MTDPTFTPGVTGQGVVVTPVKLLVIEALRNTFVPGYPDTKLNDLNIDLEYPIDREKYPGIWVRFSLSRLQILGIANLTTVVEDDSTIDVYQVWRYEGTVSLNVVAFTSKERDLISDGIIEAFAFGRVKPSASPFAQTISESPLVNMTINSDELISGGQTEIFGTPWQNDQVVYEDRYSFDCIGEVRSRVEVADPSPWVQLSEVQAFSEITNVDGAPTGVIPGDDNDGVWQ